MSDKAKRQPPAGGVKCTVEDCDALLVNIPGGIASICPKGHIGVAPKPPISAEDHKRGVQRLKLSGLSAAYMSECVRAVTAEWGEAVRSARLWVIPGQLGFWRRWPRTTKRLAQPRDGRVLAHDVARDRPVELAPYLAANVECGAVILPDEREAAE